MELTISNLFQTLWQSTSIAAAGAAQWKDWIMVAVALILLYLGIFKKIEPLLLVPIGFGALLSNLPVAGGYFLSLEYVKQVGELNQIVSPRLPLLGDILYFGVKNEIYPILIFIGIGAMTDFGPLIAQPSSFLMGAAAQFGVYAALIISVVLGFNLKEAAAIGIIGGADGPTAIYLAVKLAPHLLGPIAVAAYTYMSLVPIIQPPIMRLMVTEKEAKVRMKELRTVSKVERILFPIAITVVTSIFVPASTPLIGAIMFGNLLKEAGETRRLAETAGNELHKHCYYIPSVGSRSFYESRHVPHFANVGDCGSRCIGFCICYVRWFAFGETYVLHNRWKGESSHWLGRGFSRTHVCPSFSNSSTVLRSKQFCADACYGAQRSRSCGDSCCSWCFPRTLRRLVVYGGVRAFNVGEILERS